MIVAGLWHTVTLALHAYFSWLYCHMYLHDHRYHTFCAVQLCKAQSAKFMTASAWSPAVQHSSASQHVVLLQHPEGRCKSYDEGQEGRLHCAHVCLRYALSCVAAKAQHCCRPSLHQPLSPAAAWVLCSINSIVLLLAVSLLIVIVNLLPVSFHVASLTQHAAHHMSVQLVQPCTTQGRLACD